MFVGVAYWSWRWLLDFISSSSANVRAMSTMGLLFLAAVVVGGILLITAVGLGLYFFFRDREK